MAKHFKGEKDRALAAAVAPRGNVFTRFTLRSLRANRVRTVVSVIGIALSCALITAVLTSVVSLTDALFATIFLSAMPMTSPSFTEKPFILVERTAWVTSAVFSSVKDADIAE